MASGFDDFSSYTVQSGIPSGYTNISGGSAGTVSIETDAAVPGGKVLRIAAPGGNHRVFSRDDIVATADQQVFALVRTSALTDNTRLPNAFTRAHATDVTFYEGSLVRVTSSDMRAQENRLLAGSFSNVASQGSQTFTADTIYALRQESTSTTQRMRWWVPADLNNPSADEPATWAASGTNSDITSGLPAIGVRQGGAGNLDIIAWGWGTGGEAAPTSGTVATPTGLTVTQQGTGLRSSWTSTESEFILQRERWTGSGSPA